MNTVMATWQKPVEVWGYVGAISSEFQETTNWADALEGLGPEICSVEHQSFLSKAMSSGCVSSRSSTMLTSSHSECGKLGLVYHDGFLSSSLTIH